MLQRVLTISLSLLFFSQLAFGQVDLSSAKEKIKNEQLTEAEEELKSHLGQKVKNLNEVYYWLGIIKIQEDNYDAAKDFFQAGLKTKSKCAYNHAGMGLVQIKEGDLTTANESLTKAVTFNKGKDINAEFEIAKAYLTGETSEIAEAKVLLYQIRDKNPELPETYIQLGDYYLTQSVPELAIEEFEKAKQKDPSYVPAYVALAELYYNEKQFGEGFKNVQEAIKLDPEYGPAYRIRGELYLLADQDKVPNKFELARNDLKKYVTIANNDLKARIRYASFLFLTEDYQEALDELAEIEKDTLTRVMLRLKGIAYNKLGQNDKAKATMDKYFEQSDEKYTISIDYESYGNILRSMVTDYDAEKLKKADEYYTKAIELNEERGVIFDEIAEEYASQAKVIKNEAKAIRKERSAIMKEAQAAFSEYNALVKKAKAEETPIEEKKAAAAQAKEVYANAESLKNQADAKIPESEAKAAEADPFYPFETHYRQLILDEAKMNDRSSLQIYYKLALAQYNAGMLEEADENFKETNKLKPDYFAPYSYRMQIANKLEKVDTVKMDWYLKPVAEDIITVYGEKDPTGLKKSEKTGLLTAYEILANYSFNPSGEEGDYHCGDAKPYFEKIYAVDPNYTRIQQLVDYCASQGGR